jgi:hypothetical protein
MNDVQQLCSQNACMNVAFEYPVMTKLLHVVMSVVHLVSCYTKNSSSSKPVTLFIQVCLHPNGK